MKVRIDPVFYWIPLGILVLDFVTKWIIGIKLGPMDSIVIIPGYLNLIYVQNSGVAFGILADIESTWKPYILSGIGIVAATGITLYGICLPRNFRFLRWTLAIITGGILGNIVDRMLRGYVVDFIDFHIHDVFHWPAFNVADSAITIGIGFMILDTVKTAISGRQHNVDRRQ